jgi:signal peptidase I
MKNSSRAAREIAEWAVNLVILLFATTTIAQPFVVPTGSMENTVLVGDHLLVDKLAYAPPDSLSRLILPYSEVKRGDVIVFRYPLNLRENYVKRVIGVPGDRVRIRAKQVFVNGRPLEEPYKVVRSGLGVPYLDEFPSQPPDLIHIYDRGEAMLRDDVVSGELVVPPGSYFAMGDNRDNSSDSRFWGLVPRENIIGKPWVIFWSYDAPTDDFTGVVNVDHVKDLALNFFTKTRWDRTLRVVH